MITKKEIKILKDNIEKMAKSNEQFIFMIYKNPDGTDNITQYGYNMPKKKLAYYFREAIKSSLI